MEFGRSWDRIMVAARKLVKVLGVGDPDHVPCTVLIMTLSTEVVSWYHLVRGFLSRIPEQ